MGTTPELKEPFAPLISGNELLHAWLETYTNTYRENAICAIYDYMYTKQEGTSYGGII